MNEYVVNEADIMNSIVASNVDFTDTKVHLHRTKANAKATFSLIFLAAECEH